MSVSCEVSSLNGTIRKKISAMGFFLLKKKQKTRDIDNRNHCENIFDRLIGNILSENKFKFSENYSITIKPLPKTIGED